MGGLEGAKYAGIGEVELLGVKWDGPLWCGVLLVVTRPRGEWPEAAGGNPLHSLDNHDCVQWARSRQFVGVKFENHL